MTEQTWNFHAIEGASGGIHAQQGRTADLLLEGEGSLQKLSSIWGGEGNEAYTMVQRKWNDASNQLNDALRDLGMTISEAGKTMNGVDSKIAGGFHGM